jgi:hypothetical protein
MAVPHGRTRSNRSFVCSVAFDSEGNVYFGSDDGYAYCVSADTRELRWRFSPRPAERRIVNNGRLVSMWPIRTGVLIDGDRAYFGASMLPWQESYLCAVDAATGATEGDGQFVAKIDAATMEGPLSIVPGRLLVAPQGRVAPRLFSLDEGNSLGQLQGGGGSFVVLTKDSVFHGPGNKTGWLTASSLESLETVASFKRGNAMVVAGDVSFILTDHGSHLSRPAIVGQRLFVRPAVFDLTIGAKLPEVIPVGGCGTYACSDHALFFRAGSAKNSAMWTMDNGRYTMWDRLRPDCWLSTIPAGGMLLSPEGGGGCSCGSWMETSLGFLPARALTVENLP